MPSTAHLFTTCYLITYIFYLIHSTTHWLGFNGVSCFIVRNNIIFYENCFEYSKIGDHMVLKIRFQNVPFCQLNVCDNGVNVTRYQNLCNYTNVEMRFILN